MDDTHTVNGEQLLASAVQYLIEGGETRAAELLVFCTVETVEQSYINYQGNVATYHADISLRGPRAVCERIGNEALQDGDQIKAALSAVLPFNWYLDEIHTRATIHVPDENWRNDLLELIRGKGVSNQASGADTGRLWQGLKFRSATEIRIAEALDRAKVLFFPLPKARLTGQRGRFNAEPDFVVCDEGRWGILEVDGEPFHPPQRSAMEHGRDRLFLDHGIRVVQRFDATDCFATPDKVVSDFLRILKRTYS